MSGATPLLGDDTYVIDGEYMYYDLVDPATTSVDDYGTCSVTAVDHSQAVFSTWFQPYITKNGFTYRVTSMDGCFANNPNFTGLTPMGSILAPGATFYVTSAVSAFENCTALVDAQFMGQLISVSPIQDYTKCFKGCTSLTNTPGFSLVANGYPLMNFTECFYGCTSLVSVANTFIFLMDNSIWGDDSTSEQSSYVFMSCFYGCTALTTLPINGMPPETVSMERCFYGCSSLTDVHLASRGGNDYYLIANTKVTNLDYCFWGCTQLTNTIEDYPTTVSSMKYTYANCRSLTSVPSNGLPYGQSFENLVYLDDCFINCTSLEHCYAGVNWSVVSASYCFWGCTSLISVGPIGVNIGYWSGGMRIIAPNLRTITGIFTGCTNLNCEINSDAYIQSSQANGAFSGTTKEISIYYTEDLLEPADKDSWYNGWYAAAQTSANNNVRVLYYIKNLPPNIEYRIVRRVGSNGSRVADPDGTWVYLKLYTTVYFNAVNVNKPRIPEITVDSVVVQAGGGDTTPVGSATYEFWYDTQTTNAVTLGFTPYDLYNGIDPGHTDPTPIYVVLPSGFVVLEVYPGGHGIGLGMGAIVNQLTVGYNTWIYGQVNAGDSLTNTESYSSIVGGSGHTITNQANYAGIFGGLNNTVYAPRAAILGGSTNVIGSTTQNSDPAMQAVIVGGNNNSIISSSTTTGAQNTAIVGGGSNHITGTGNYAGIFGGYSNTLSGGCADSAIVGGYGNTISSTYSGMVGGQQNSISRTQSAIVGGSRNTVSGKSTTGYRAVILGGRYLHSYADNQVVMGQFNATSETAAIVVGNGTSSTAQSNGWELDPDGTQRVQSTPDLPVLHYSEFPTTLFENDTLPVKPCLMITDDGSLYFCYEDSGSAMTPQ